MQVRNSEGVLAKLRARSKRQFEAVKAATADGLDLVFNSVLADVNRLTGYMASQTTPKLTNDGFGFSVGWYAEDFIGQTNPVTGQTITSFYPEFVIRGTRFMAGNDVLTAALREHRERIRRGYRRALSLRSSA